MTDRPTTTQPTSPRNAPRQPTEEFTATVSHVRWSARSRDPQNPFKIVVVQWDEQIESKLSRSDQLVKKLVKHEASALGDDHCDDLTPGLTYRFLGRWEDNEKHGRQFRFRNFIKQEPLSREGVVKYLAKYATNIGPAIANRLYDQFGSNAIRVLRNCPEDAATVKGLTLGKATEAAAELEKLKRFEETRVELNDLLASRGFPSSLPEQVIKKWGVNAPRVIRRDPFSLLVVGFGGCGFNRCDRLYLDLGLPANRLKRQMLCAWHAMKSSMDGHTWFSLAWVKTQIEKAIASAEVKPVRALKLGVRSRWLSVRKDESGQVWFAERSKAENEGVIAGVVVSLLRAGAEGVGQMGNGDPEEDGNPTSPQREIKPPWNGNAKDQSHWEGRMRTELDPVNNGETALFHVR